MTCNRHLLQRKESEREKNKIQEEFYRHSWRPLFFFSFSPSFVACWYVGMVGRVGTRVVWCKFHSLTTAQRAFDWSCWTSCIDRMNFNPQPSLAFQARSRKKKNTSFACLRVLIQPGGRAQRRVELEHRIVPYRSLFPLNRVGLVWFVWLSAGWYSRKRGCRGWSAGVLEGLSDGGVDG